MVHSFYNTQLSAISDLLVVIKCRTKNSVGSQSLDYALKIRIFEAQSWRKRSRNLVPLDISWYGLLWTSTKHYFALSISYHAIFYFISRIFIGSRLKRPWPGTVILPLYNPYISTEIFEWRWLSEEKLNGIRSRVSLIIFEKTLLVF